METLRKALGISYDSLGPQQLHSPMRKTSVKMIDFAHEPVGEGFVELMLGQLGAHVGS